MFSSLSRSWFRAPIHDVYCGLRGFTKLLYQSLDQRCTGMEFATEMIIKSSLFSASRKCRLRSTPTGVSRTRPTFEPSATAGGRCGSS